MSADRDAAKDRWVYCPVCLGTGTAFRYTTKPPKTEVILSTARVPKPETCPNCERKGYVRA